MKVKGLNEIVDDRGTEMYYYPCECSQSLIQLEIEKEEDWKGVYFAIFECGQPIHSLGNKLRNIWKIIRTGTPFGDQIILKFSDARALAKNILKRAGEEVDEDKRVKI